MAHLRTSGGQPHEAGSAATMGSSAATSAIGDNRLEAELPERPAQPDCTFYLRTGACGYGPSCRFNHPPLHTQPITTEGGAAVGERSGTPRAVERADCQYYLTNGICKFGASCKFNHPPKDMMTVALNSLNLPIRPGEKECAHYLRTGRCKFGPSCKFHHPPPPLPPLGAYSPGGNPPLLSLSQTALAPMLGPHLGHRLLPWNIPMGSRPLHSPGSGGPAYMYAGGPAALMGMAPPGYPVAMQASPDPTSARPRLPIMYAPTLAADATGTPVGFPPYFPTAVMPTPAPPVTSAMAGPMIQSRGTFPGRPGQPECQFYMKTGDCKFGATCKFHHPKERAALLPSCILSPLGLPLRPGQTPCAFYQKFGTCKFGFTCKFDHPMDNLLGPRLQYSPSSGSLADMPVAPLPSPPVIVSSLALPMAGLTLSSQSQRVGMVSASVAEAQRIVEAPWGASGAAE